MGGKEASRGFLYQAFASVLEALTDERSWDKIYVEYQTSNDKVDIALEENKQIIKCIQVKSSINIFKQTDIINWINELIKDKESPEYKIILIGQCNETANTFIKSISKYYGNELDAEAKSSLEGFDTSLLENRRIYFSVLPFEIDNLIKIVRDSLHKYISYSNRAVSFDQIDFIASAMVEDQMVSSTHGEGIDRKKFDKCLEKRILLTADRYSPKRTSIEVISFDCGIEKEAESRLSFIDKFHMRVLKEGYNWDDDIYKRLDKFLHESTNDKGAYQLFLKTHTSIAFAAGRILNSKTGINIVPVQKTANSGMVLWDVKYGKGVDYCNWKVAYDQLQSDQSDSALILNITHNIKDEVISFIKAHNLLIGRLINCIPKGIGATNISIKDGTHAFLLANDIYNAIRNRSIMERRATMHIFASAPNAFMFFLGQNSIGFGKCILYEYDFEQRNSCTYSQSMSFID